MSLFCKPTFIGQQLIGAMLLYAKRAQALGDILTAIRACGQREVYRGTTSSKGATAEGASENSSRRGSSLDDAISTDRSAWVARLSLQCSGRGLDEKALYFTNGLFHPELIV